MFSDFHLNEDNSSHHPTVAPSDFPTVLPHALTSSALGDATSSTGKLAKAARRSPLPSNLKQGTNDAGSSRPGSAKIITISIYKAEMEKKTGMQPTDEGKKLTCRKSLYEKHSMQ